MTETGPPSRGVTLHVALRLRQPIELKADVAVAPGHMVALVGPSGVGKSSVLRAVAGVLPHAQGEIRLGQQVWL
ncbi:MAG: ATP-binding cassette domain-containing protein, partial [Burkholderiaceae bacterium]